MFVYVIGIVFVSWSPINYELALAHAVSDPVETHIKGFGCFLFDAIVGETCCPPVLVSAVEGGRVHRVQLEEGGHLLQ